MSPRAPHRFYFAGQLNQADPGAIRLAAEESHHLLRVLRLRPGTQIDVFDAGGRAYSAEILGEQDGQATLRLLDQIEADPPTAPPLFMAVSVIKRRPMDWMIEKLSELGTDTLLPLIASRSIGQGDIKPNSDPPERWDRLAIAAAKQCGRNRPLTIMPPAPVTEWLQRTRPPAHTIFAHPAAGAKSIGQYLQERSSVALPMWVAIGPEGGFTPAEQESFERAGFKAVRLGDLILRSETAAIAAAAACQLRPRAE